MRKKLLKRLDVPLVIAGRSLTADIMDLAAVLGKAVTTRSWYQLWHVNLVGDSRYRMAVSRLRKLGLVTRRADEKGPSEFLLTDKGRSRVAGEFIPEVYWNKEWNENWWLLTYDVPEKSRRYRVVLQSFLRKARMGCLHKSVWISSHDIRPLFDDLSIAAEVRRYAFLFECSTVLGQSGPEVARGAWGFNALHDVQIKYISACAGRIKGKMDGVQRGTPGLLTSLRWELAEYSKAMENDPLLPISLYPEDYAGREVVRIFRERMLQCVRG